VANQFGGDAFAATFFLTFVADENIIGGKSLI